MARGLISAFGYGAALNPWVSYSTYWGAYKSVWEIVTGSAGGIPLLITKKKKQKT